MAAHSPIGFSGASRYMACPGSVRLSRGIPNTESEFAKHGTAAHHFGEYVLVNGLDPSAYLGWWVTAEGTVMKHKPNTEGAFEIDGEMVDAITTYAEFVRSKMVSGDQLFVEVKFHLPDIHPLLFGTADVVIYSPSRRKVFCIDLKYGVGVVVDVIDSAQLNGYAIGALTGEWDGIPNPIGPVDEIEVAIVQPRAFHAGGPIRTDTTHVIELADWIEVFREATHATDAPDAPLKIGEHCRFCPAAAICPQQILEVQTNMPEIPTGTEYDPQVLADGLAWIKLAKARMKAIENFAESEAINRGVKIPGFKVVQGEGNRVFTDTDKALAVLVKEGYTAAEVMTDPMPAQLKSVAQVEETIGKSRFAELLSELVVKPETRKQLAPLRDKRPEILYNPRSGFVPVEQTEQENLFA